MINAITKLLSAASSSRLESVAHQVAEACIDEVSELVLGKVESMTFSEARGYVRARAARVTRKHARLVLSKMPGSSEAWLEEVTRRATERIVPQVLRQTGVGVPAQVTALRLAA